MVHAGGVQRYQLQELISAPVAVPLTDLYADGRTRRTDSSARIHLPARHFGCLTCLCPPKTMRNIPEEESTADECAIDDTDSDPELEDVASFRRVTIRKLPCRSLIAQMLDNERHHASPSTSVPPSLSQPHKSATQSIQPEVPPPRASLRKMILTELSVDVRIGLVWERSEKRGTADALRRHREKQMQISGAEAGPGAIDLERDDALVLPYVNDRDQLFSSAERNHGVLRLGRDENWHEYHSRGW